MKDTLRQITVALTILATLVVNGLANALPLNGLTTGEISNRFKVYFVPAGYAFSIWGLIYFGLIFFAFFQALPSQRENPRLRAAGWWIFLNGLANSAWLFLWHYEQFPLTVAAMLVLLTTLIVAYLCLGIGRTSVPVTERLAVRLPISIYLGWITVAAVANITSVLDFLQWARCGIAPEIWMGIVLVAVLTITTLMNFTRRDVAYALVILWALAGISVKHADVTAVAIPTWITFGLVALTLVAALLRQRLAHVKEPGSVKKRIVRITLVLFAVLLLIVLVGPFLIPVPPLEGTLPPQALADPDSQFIEINGLSVHVKTRGQGEPTFVLLHGFGASLYTWQAVMEPLSQLGTTIAFDRPAFGLTERPLNWEGQNPYSPEAQVELLIELLDHLGLQQVILVGHSAGGTIAMQTTLAHPERVSALILVDPAVYNGGGAPGWVRPLLATPQMRHLGPLLARLIKTRGPDLIELAWHDPSHLPPETLDLYQKPLQVENWDKALWEFTLASRASGFVDRLDKFTLPVLVITGDDDRIVPTADSIQLAGELPNSQLVVIANAGHVPQEERPVEFMEAVTGFLKTVNYPTAKAGGLSLNPESSRPLAG